MLTEEVKRNFINFIEEKTVEEPHDSVKHYYTAFVQDCKKDKLKHARLKFLVSMKKIGSRVSMKNSLVLWREYIKEDAPQRINVSNSLETTMKRLVMTEVADPKKNKVLLGKIAKGYTQVYEEVASSFLEKVPSFLDSSETQKIVDLLEKKASDIQKKETEKRAKEDLAEMVETEKLKKKAKVEKEAADAKEAAARKEKELEEQAQTERLNELARKKRALEEEEAKARMEEEEAREKMASLEGKKEYKELVKLFKNDKKLANNLKKHKGNQYWKNAVGDLANSLYVFDPNQSASNADKVKFLDKALKNLSAIKAYITNEVKNWDDSDSQQDRYSVINQLNTVLGIYKKIL